jgi:hypothetical protein
MTDYNIAPHSKHFNYIHNWEEDEFDVHGSIHLGNIYVQFKV